MYTVAPLCHLINLCKERIPPLAAPERMEEDSESSSLCRAVNNKDDIRGQFRKLVFPSLKSLKAMAEPGFYLWGLVAKCFSDKNRENSPPPPKKKVPPNAGKRGRRKENVGKVKDILIKEG